MPSRMEALFARRAAERRAEALPRAIAALEALHARGVDAGVIGSLARDRMREHSDVDFLIIDENGIFYDDIIALIERHLRPLPIDVVFLRWVGPDDREGFMRGIRRVDELRARLAPV